MLRSGKEDVNDREQTVNSPDGYTYVNTRYMNKNNGLVRTRTNDQNLKLVGSYFPG